MIQQKYFLHYFIVLILTLSACIKVAINLATPTAIERQMIGEYQQIDEELLYAATARSQGFSDSEEMTKSVEARLHQSYNLDDIISLKEQGCLGESVEGKLIPIECEAIKKNMDLRNLQIRMASEENNDRTIILEEVKKKNKLLKDLTLSELFLLHRQLLLSTALENQLFETAEGDKKIWVNASKLQQEKTQ